MARTRLAAGLLLCVALASALSARAEEAEAVVTVTDADGFDKLIKVRSNMIQLPRRSQVAAGSVATQLKLHELASAAWLL
jgi:hypothetical protein